MAQHVDWTDVEALERTSSQSSMDLFGILWRRKWIVLCLTVIAAAVGYLYFLRATPVYRSYAQLLLVKKDAGRAMNVTGKVDASGLSYEDALSTHMLLIRTALVVGKAVEKRHLGSLRSLQGVGEPVSAIINDLSVARTGDKAMPDPNIFELRYDSVDARDCSTVLDAVIESYQDFLETTYQNHSEETLQLIAQAKDVLSKQLSEKEGSYRKFKQGSPLLWTSQASINLHEQRMTDIERSRAQVIVEATQIKAKLDSIQTAIKSGGNKEALLLLLGRAQNGNARSTDSPRQAFEDRLFTILLEEQDLLQMYGPDHPMVKAAQRKLTMIRSRLSDMPLPDSGENVDFLSVYLESLRQEMKVAEQRLTELNTRFEMERKSAKEMADSHDQDESFRAEIARLQQMFEVVIKRLNEINLTKDYGGISTKVITQPGLGMLVRPQLPVVIGLAIVLGILSGFGLGYLIDIADKSFRSPEEIRRQLGLPIIGHIPVIERPRRRPLDTDPAKAALASSLCTYHFPKGRSAEAYRAVRTALYFSTDGEGYKVIQVTSPNPGDGKTTMAANLAISVADSGKRVLLMEADFRRPKIHEYFGLSNEVGVSAVISGQAEIAEALQETPVKNLWAMPCGARPNNPSDLLTSPGFKELIDYVRERFDFVIVDSPPILAVTDPSVVAPRVDAVLLVVRLTKHAREAATRATEMLGALGARILGVVVNGVGRSTGYGYNYQRYHGYQYGYRYNRYGSYGGYGDGYGGGVGYYSDDTHEAPRAGSARKEPDKAKTREMSS